MSRADLAFWSAVGSLPITMDGVSDGMWALILIIALILMLAHDATKSNRRYNEPPHYPPHYPPHW